MVDPSFVESIPAKSPQWHSVPVPSRDGLAECHTTFPDNPGSSKQWHAAPKKRDALSWAFAFHRFWDGPAPNEGESIPGRDGEECPPPSPAHTASALEKEKSGCETLILPIVETTLPFLWKYWEDGAADNPIPLFWPDCAAGSEGFDRFVRP